MNMGLNAGLPGAWASMQSHCRWGAIHDGIQTRLHGTVQRHRWCRCGALSMASVLASSVLQGSWCRFGAVVDGVRARLDASQSDNIVGAEAVRRSCS